MRDRLLLLCLVLVSARLSAQVEVPTPAFSAAQIAAAVALREQALAGSGAYELVAALTTEVGPRMAGTEADARAVRWAEAKFRALGFDRVSLQPVTFPVWQRRSESAEVLAPAPQKLAVTALGWSSATPASGIAAEVVGFADLDALKAADPATIKGRIVYVSHHMQPRRNGSGYRPAVALRVTGAEVAAQKGALALLIRSIGTDHHRLPHTGVGMSQAQIESDAEIAKRAVKLDGGGLAVLTAVPAAALSNPDADQVERLLRLPSALRIRLRVDAGLAGMYTSYNVIGDVLGRERPDEVFVIGGHLDSWDLGTGAIDDGAGVAITMAAARLIAQAPTRPRRTVRVVAFANEEQGVFGGKAYADGHDARLHVGGAESDFGAGRVYRFDYQVPANYLPAVQQIAEVLAPLDIERGSNEAGGGADIGALGQAGVPMFDLQQDGSDYFNLHHTADDTLDKIDPKALDQNVAAFATLVYLVADRDPTTATTGAESELK